MASNLNRITASGNLVADPVFKEFDNGGGVTKMRLAVNGYRDDDVCYIDANIFQGGSSERAKKASQLLNKGTKIIVDGSLKYEEYVKDNVKRSSYSIRVDNWHFAGGKGDGAAKKETATADDLPF